MVQLPVVYREWVMKDSSWHFVVDNRKGGRMFFLSDGCTHGELVEMAQDDYMLDKKNELVELTYSLPDSILEKMALDTPSMHVINDRQVRSLIELSRTHVVRLCVSSRFDMDTENNDDVDGHADEDCDEDVDENVEECMDEDVDGFSGGDVMSIDGIEKDEDKEDEDYSQYGKVKGEDEDDMWFDDEDVKAGSDGQGGRYETTWSDKIYVKASFSSKDELVSELRLMAVMLKFAFKVYKSTKILFVAKCCVKGCEWKLRAGVKNESNTFWVTKYVRVHTCSVADRMANRRNSTPRYIATLFIERFGIIDGITTKHIKDSMRVNFGMKMDYTTSYRALIYAQELVRGTTEDGYGNLPSYLHLIEKANPGTVTGLELDDKNRFKYLFISFGASIAGFQYLRRVIVVDGCHLTGKYGDVMLVATAQDGNFQIFPLAFGIVDSENDDAWEWFFTKLRGCISDEYHLVIVSDRHISIKKACDMVFPWATRGICYYHLQQNIVTKFKGKRERVNEILVLGSPHRGKKRINKANS